jgi:hypothetical protein
MQVAFRFLSGTGSCLSFRCADGRPGAPLAASRPPNWSRVAGRTARRFNHNHEGSAIAATRKLYIEKALRQTCPNPGLVDAS